MSTERDQAIDKIKKLLRMKRGGTAAEIETALALAQEIAHKHGIDIASVNPEEEEQARPIGHEDGFQGARIQFECKYAGMICDRFFNVEVFTSGRGSGRLALTFVGTEWDRQIAIYVYRFLVGHFRREWKHTRSRNRQVFMWGLFVGLSSKLRDAQKEPEGAALVYVGRALQRRRDYVEKYFGKLESNNVKPDAKADDSFRRGFYAGLDTNIRPAVESGQPKPKELTL